MEQKHILIAVSGGIAAYKACDLVSRLSKTCHAVRVIMTEHAAEFVRPLTFASLSGRPVLTGLFEEGSDDPIAHISLAEWADVLCVVPATANLIAKAANGIGDDLVSTVCLAAHTKKILCPAMNVHMYENPAVQRNLSVLREDGWQIIDPVSGLLACKESGQGKLASVDTICTAIEQALSDPSLPLAGRTVLVTAGPTREPLDPVRFISNRSTGKQGYAIARAARDLGASVLLVSGPVSLPAPEGVEVLPVETAQQMFEAVKSHYADADFLVLSAAVSDFRPASFCDHKIKKSAASLEIPLVSNPDILAWLGENRLAGQVVCGFAMETESLEENGRGKLLAKNCDLLAANNLFDRGAGFAGDTNSVLLITRDKTEKLPLCSKEELGHILLERMEKIHAAGN